MKALHEEAQPVETHSNGTTNGTVSLNGTAAPVTAAPVTAAPVTAAPVTAAPVTAAPVEVAPGVFMVPGRKRTGQEANKYLLAKNAELYRRLAK
jgi:hypothetical protein